MAILAQHRVDAPRAPVSFRNCALDGMSQSSGLVDERFRRSDACLHRQRTEANLRIIRAASVENLGLRIQITCTAQRCYQVSNAKPLAVSAKSPMRADNPWMASAATRAFAVLATRPNRRSGCYRRSRPEPRRAKRRQPSVPSEAVSRAGTISRADLDGRIPSSRGKCQPHPARRPDLNRASRRNWASAPRSKFPTRCYPHPESAYGARAEKGRRMPFPLIVGG